MKSPTQEVFNTQVDNALSNLVSGQRWPCFKLEVGLETSRDAFQANGYHDSVMAV